MSLEVEALDHWLDLNSNVHDLSSRASSWTSFWNRDVISTYPSSLEYCTLHLSPLYCKTTLTYSICPILWFIVNQSGLNTASHEHLLMVIWLMNQITLHTAWWLKYCTWHGECLMIQIEHPGFDSASLHQPNHSHEKMSWKSDQESSVWSPMLVRYTTVTVPVQAEKKKNK